MNTVGCYKRISLNYYCDHHLTWLQGVILNFGLMAPSHFASFPIMTLFQLELNSQVTEWAIYTPLPFQFIQITEKILVKSRPHFSLWFLFSRKKMVADPFNPPLTKGRDIWGCSLYTCNLSSSNCFLGRWSTDKRELCHLVIDYSFSPSHSPHLFHMTFTKASMMLYSSISRERKCLAIRDPFVSSQIILFLLYLGKYNEYFKTLSKIFLRHISHII